MTLATEGRPATYARDVVRLLWPAPWDEPRLTMRPSRSGGDSRGFAIFPLPSRPRILLPTGVAEASAMLGRLGDDRSRASRTLRALAGGLVRSAVFAHLPWPRLHVAEPGGAQVDSIDAYLATVLGCEVRVGIVLGTPRANQKPVLQVFAADGRLLGYAKVGHNRLTSELVCREAATLAVLNEHETSTFTAPRLVHAGSWRGLEVLMMSPLSGRPGLETPTALRLAAMRELATLSGTTWRPLSESRFWSRLDAEVGSVQDPQVAGRLRTSRAQIQEQWGGTEVGFGAWHGDWGHWNMAHTGTTVGVWDWERFDPEVPVGFDGLHHLAQQVRPGQPDFHQRERDFLSGAAEDLGHFDVPPALRDLTVLLYLLEISVRYAGALEQAAPPALRARSSWALTLLEQQVRTHIVPTVPGGRP